MSQVFSCHFCEIFKNTFFIEHLPWLVLPILKPLDLLHPNIISSSWHFCVYFWGAQAFLLHLDVPVVEEI